MYRGYYVLHVSVYVKEGEIERERELANNKWMRRT